jgi:hypothetical protein
MSDLSPLMGKRGKHNLWRDYFGNQAKSKLADHSSEHSITAHRHQCHRHRLGSLDILLGEVKSQSSSAYMHRNRWRGDSGDTLDIAGKI